MPLGSALNSLLLLAKNMDPTKSTVMPVKKIKNDKPVVFPIKAKIKSLERDVPENHGYTKEFLDSFFNELNSDFSIRTNRLLILKDNKVIYERYEYPYVKNSWDCVFSSSKTLVALALGVLFDQGKVDLDLPVYKILDNEKTIGNSKNKKITLRHLLTMSTGNTFNELETASSHKWIKSFFDSNLKFKLGSKFEYNSLNTYVISACVEKLAGIKFEKFVRENIFNPLDINLTHLDTSEEGYFKGGWGLYILPEDMAKLGLLVANDGEVNGKRIISKKWIHMMSHKQFDATKFGHVLDYGFQMWVDEKNDMAMFNGMYDQDILIYRKTGVVIVTCSANNEAFHGANLYKTLNKYFAKKNIDEIELYQFKANRELINNKSIMYHYDLIANKEYKTSGKIANSCGILPLILQNELGTYSRGIKSVIFKKDGASYALVVNEGNKYTNLIFNFDKGVRLTYDFFGNLFDCVCDARFILSGKSEPYLVIRLFFLEFSSSRYFTVKFSKDYNHLSMELSENPGLDFVFSLVEVQDESVKKFITGLSNTINPSYAVGMIKNIFSPSFPLNYEEDKNKKVVKKAPPKQIKNKKG